MASTATQTMVNLAYRDIFGRDSVSDEGRRYWENLVEAGILDETQLRNELRSSHEALVHAWKIVEQVYTEVMGRHVDQAGGDYWVGLMLSGQIPFDATGLATRFQTTDEYRQRQAAGTAGPGLGVAPGAGGAQPAPDPTPDTTVPPTTAVPDAPPVISGTIQSLLNRYDLGALAPAVLAGMEEHGERFEGMFPSWIEEQDLYKQRFSAIFTRREQGLPAINAEEYIDLEQSMHSLFRAAGLPSSFYDQLTDFTGFIERNVSVAELGSRLDEGYLRVLTAPPEVRIRFAQLFGVEGDAALAAYFLDPDKASHVLEREVATADVAGYGDAMGFNLNGSMALRLAELGYTGRSAMQGFSQVQSQLPLFTESISETEDFTAEGEGMAAAFGLDPAAGQALVRRVRSRVGQLSGGGGLVLTDAGLGGTADR